MRTPSPPLERRLRRRVAEVAFVLRAARVLVRPALLLLLVFATGTVIFHFLGAPRGGEAPQWDESMFAAYALLMGEVATALPANYWAQAVLYLLPIAGILFLAEGLLRLGLTVFDKHEHPDEWIKIMAQHSRDHILLCGLGTVGIRVLEELIAHGEQVFVVERNADGEFVARARDLGAEVLIGDARAENLLRSLNVATARAVVIVTDDDLANLEIAMDVREIRQDVPIILRLFDQRLAQKVKATMGVQVSLSTSMVAAPVFASAALDERVVGAHRVGDALLLVVELAVGPRLVGATAATLPQHGVSLVAVQKGGTWSPAVASTTPLALGDRIQVLVPSAQVKATRALEG